MTAVAALVNVGTTPTVLCANVSPDPYSGKSCAISNQSGATLFVGGPTVDTTNGYPIPTGTTASFDLDPSDVLFGIFVAAANVNVLRLGV